MKQTLSANSQNMHVRGFVKKFVDWCDKIDVIQAKLTIE